MTTLRELAPDLWIADQPLRFFGIEIGASMTVVRLPGWRLPHRFHHLYVGHWGSAYPTCRLYAAPGLDTMRPDLALSGILDEGASTRPAARSSRRISCSTWARAARR